jgi:transcriptional regulator with XRE-family HTH domain
MATMVLLQPSVVAPLIFRVRSALTMSQRELGETLGVAKKTVMRWELRRSMPYHGVVEQMARLVYTRDPALAQDLAAAMGGTLASLGIEVVPAPKVPTVEHLVDSVLCAAAEAAAIAPKAMRAGLAAAFERMAALDLTAAQVSEALGRGKKSRTK